jgi:hypothetical protein
MIYELLTLSKPALIVTITVITLMSTAPAAGLNKIPALYKMPAA